MIPNIGPMEVAIVAIVVLIIFGPKRLPELGSSMGRGIRDFGKGLKGESEAPAAELESTATATPVPEPLDKAGTRG